MLKSIDLFGYLVYEDGRIRSKDNTKDLKQFTKKTVKMGYKFVSLMINGRVTQKSVHQVVYRAFYGKIPKGMTVDHIDDNPLNNHYTNLQLMTTGANSAKGSRIVPFKDLTNIQERLVNGERNVDLAKEYGVSQQCICDIKHNRRNKY
tara:strand:+ start:318 stop:761 length:444 start_codon:yes stop_codon:yes gene_type:complete